MEKYTGRQIAIFTDIHGLLEPTIAILDDINKRGIKEIYSLGDNIGFGPNPCQVIDLLIENNVKSIIGNGEEYSIIGTEPFKSVFCDTRRAIQEWTYKRLTKEHLDFLINSKHSYDLLIGGQRVGLCHFINDVRCDYQEHNTWTYQNAIKNRYPNPQEQFYYTNSKEQLDLIEYKSHSILPEDAGYVSAKKDPIFNGKQINYYQEIIQGHVHFKLLTEDDILRVRTVRAAGIGYKNDPIDSASYIIIHEKENGYDIEEMLVSFDRAKTLKRVDNSSLPNKDTINSFLAR